MEIDDRRELGKFNGGVAAAGVAMLVAAAFLTVSTFWDARGLDSTVGEVVGTREVDTRSGPRPDLLVGYQTSAGDTMMFAEEIGSLAPEVGDWVTVWYSDGASPRAMIARQRFFWPVLLLPLGLVLSAFGLWRLRRERAATSAQEDIDFELKDL